MGPGHTRWGPRSSVRGGPPASEPPAGRPAVCPRGAQSRCAPPRLRGAAGGQQAPLPPRPRPLRPGGPCSPRPGGRQMAVSRGWEGASTPSARTPPAAARLRVLGQPPRAGDLGHTRGTGAPPPPLPPELGPLCRQVCSGCHVCPHEHDRPISHLPVIGGDVRSVFRAAARIRIGLFSLLLEASLQEGHAASAISRGRALRGRRSALRCVSSLRPRPPSSQTPTLLAGASLVLTLSSRLGRTLP